MNKERSRNTQTAPKGALPAAPAGPDDIVWLRAHGGYQQWPVSPLKASFKLGSATSCDIYLDSPYVSQLHCTLERRGKRLLVSDTGSKNGLYLRERREQTFEIEAGDAFSVGTISLFAMTEAMQVARPALDYLISYREPRRVDDLMVLGVRDEPVLLIGEARCAQARIAELLHSIGPRRGRAFGELGDLAGAAEQNRRLKTLGGGTVFVDLTLPAIKREGISAAIFSPSFGLRVVARADDAEQAARALGAEGYARFGQCVVAPVRQRRDELARMIDYALVAARHPLGAVDLGERNVTALAALDWPDNIEELESTIDRIGLVLAQPSDRKAAEALGVAPSTLQRRLDRRNLVLTRPRW